MKCDANPGGGTLAQTLKAVGWAFLGVRKTTGHAEAVNKIHPKHVIVVGLLAALVFVLALVLLVRWVVHSGVAQ